MVEYHAALNTRLMAINKSDRQEHSVAWNMGDLSIQFQSQAPLLLVVFSLCGGL